MDTIPDCYFPFRLPFPPCWEAHSIPIRNRERSPPDRNSIYHLVPLPMVVYFTKGI
nr:hypothetical protein [uncultured bacterium]